MNYREYMKSPEWKALRQKVLDAAGGKCEFCGKKAVTAHHVQYPKGGYDKDHMGNLVACCWPCQERAHGIRKKAYNKSTDAAIDRIFAKHKFTNTKLRNDLCKWAHYEDCGNYAHTQCEVADATFNMLAYCKFACAMYNKVAKSKRTKDDDMMFMVTSEEIQAGEQE